MGSLPPDTAWLGQLTALRQLTQLKICFNKRDMAGSPTPSPLQLPMLPSLVSLSVRLGDVPELQLDLGRLPVLQDLEVYGGKSTLKVPASLVPAGMLRSLHVDVQLLQLDFAQLPALESARLGGELTQLQSAASSIAACSSLTRLHLGSEEYAPCNRLDYPWVAELLGNMPGCLRQLSVRGLWVAEAAAAVGALPQLEDLSLEVRGTVSMLLPPEGASAWNNLTAFKLRHGNFELPLPQVGRLAQP